MDKILLIEDDKDLNELLSLKLRQEGFEVFSFFDVQGVQNLLDEDNISVLIVDRNLATGDSGNFIAGLRAKGYNEPVIFLTARTFQRDIIDGFEKGADDYVCKPFDFKELLLRIRALIKRNTKESEKLVFKNFTLDIINLQCFYKNKLLDISNLEFELLKCFFENKNMLLSRYFLSENVWKNDNTSDKAINIALARLRKKVPELKEHIKSVRGIGYKIC